MFDFRFVHVSHDYCVIPLFEESAGEFFIIAGILEIPVISVFAGDMGSSHSQAVGQVNRQLRIEPDAETVSENLFNKTIPPVAYPDTVTVGDQDFFTEVLCLVDIVRKLNSSLPFQIIAHPEIMISGDIKDLDTGPGQVQKSGKDIEVGCRDGVFVFEPEIEKIADDIEVGTVRENHAKKIEEFGFSFRRTFPYAEMGVGDEIYLSPGCNSLLHSPHYNIIMNDGAKGIWARIYLAARKMGKFEEERSDG